MLFIQILFPFFVLLHIIFCNLIEIPLELTDYTSFEKSRRLSSKETEMNVTNRRLLTIPVLFGTPLNQKFNLMIDTGSSVLWVLGKKINGTQIFYEPSASTTYYNTHENFHVLYMTGHASGELARDVVALGDIKSQIYFGIADSAKFSNGEIDGIVGFGREEKLDRYNQSFNQNMSLFRQLRKEGAFNDTVFSIRIDKNGIFNKKASLFLGGYHEDFDSKSKTGSCNMTKVSPQKQLFACRITHIIFGDVSKNLKNKNYSFAIEEEDSIIGFDSGSNYNVFPFEFVDIFMTKFNTSKESNCRLKDGTTQFELIICDDISEVIDFSIVLDGYVIQFDKGNSFSFDVENNRYYFNSVFHYSETKIMMGIPFLMEYHTLFDLDKEVIVFYNETEKKIRSMREYSGDGSSFISRNIGKIILFSVIAVALVVVVILYYYNLKKKRELAEEITRVSLILID